MAITGPIALYSNLPINADYYQPRQFFISSITVGATTLVEATDDMDYVVGQLVRLIIPPQFGCRQLNGSQGYVVSIPASNQIVLSIDSSQSDPFVSSSVPNQPQIVAIGDVNSGIISSSGISQTSTNIPGSFINISPL